MTDGVFITLEGVEGSGKTTQAAILGDALRKNGRRVMVTHEPGGTRAGETIREIFLDPAVSLDVAAELLLVLADRAQHVREKLRPARRPARSLSRIAIRIPPPPTKATGAASTSNCSAS